MSMWCKGYYLLYATPDIEMIARMLHLPVDKNMIYIEQSVQAFTEHKPEYEIEI